MNSLKRISNEETYYPFLKDLDEAQTFTRLQLQLRLLLTENWVLLIFNLDLTHWHIREAKELHRRCSGEASHKISVRVYLIIS